MYFVKTPNIAKSLHKNAIWNMPNNNNCIYLTFDDGPTKNITSKTLDILSEFNIKATFFCIGKQVEDNPHLFSRIIDEGHSIGNHSYSHLKGWVTNSENYIEDVEKGQEITNSQLFRPPYGKIKRSQLKNISNTSKIIFWDVLPGDFSPYTSADDIVLNTINNVESGSIIVLHDNIKCGEKMLLALPSIINGLVEKGFKFSSF